MALLEFAWATTTSVNCPPGNAPAYCLMLGLRRPVAFTLIAVPAGLLTAGLGALLPPRWLRPRGPLSRLVLAPADATLVALAVVVGYAALVGPVLFDGLVTTRLAVWLVLAVPFVPFLLSFGGTYAASSAYPGDAGPVGDGLGAVGVVGLVIVTVLGQVVWFYVLARGLAGATGTISRLRRRTGS